MKLGFVGTKVLGNGDERGGKGRCELKILERISEKG
jgi:hypothetical protein